jgi:hypothetical protein
MKEVLADSKFDFITESNKDFIVKFTQEMNDFAYDCGNEIGPGFCWGHYMIIYSKTGVKAKKVIARIYIRDNGTILWGGKEHHFTNGIVLRLFLNKIDKHRAYIENAPSYIQEPIIDNNGICRHCKSECNHRKTYTINGTYFEKCDGETFWYTEPKVENIGGYMSLLKEFYAGNKTY